MLLLVLPVTCGSGLASQRFPEALLSAAPETLAYLAQTIPAFSGYRYEAQQRAHRRSRVLNIGVIVLLIPVLPCYLFVPVARGGRRGVLAACGCARRGAGSTLVEVVSALVLIDMAQEIGGMTL